VNIYKPSELKQFLDDNNKRANKRLSQNFLIDKNILEKILHSISPFKGSPVLEIGPGPGALTEQLLLKGFHVKAIELDKEFCDLLKERFCPSYPDFHVYNEDFLKFDISSLFIKSQPYTVVANLPYHISSKALIKLLINAKYFTSLTLMVQKEFFERIQTLSGKDYGIINILARICATHIDGFKVSRKCFYPAPRVDSSVLHMKLNCSINPEKLEKFYHFLKTGFSSRRKKLISNLSNDFKLETLQEAFTNYDIDENSRVESISPSTYFQLFDFLSR
jgi:16S rRNA (adenine1518-N6/adenine1519-N6)-dimethyltransferase